MEPADAARHRSRLLLCLAIVYLVWGSSYLVTRIAVQHLPPILFGGVRFLIAGLGLGAFCWRPGLLADVRRDATPLLVMGLASVALSSGLNAWAMQWVPSNLGALLNASSAFVIAVLGTLGARGHPLVGRSLAGLVTGVLGTALLLWPSPHAGTTPWLPQAGILFACLAWSAATIYLRNTHIHLDIIAFSAVQMLWGGAAMLVCGLALGETARWNWDAAGLLSMAYLVVLSAGMAYPAYAWLTRHATPSQVGSYAYVNPGVATLLGWLILDEHLSVLQCVGTAAILAGVVLVNWPAEESSAAPGA